MNPLGVADFLVIPKARGKKWWKTGKKRLYRCSPGHRGSVGCITLQVMASRVPNLVDLIRRTLQRIEASPESHEAPAAVDHLKKAVVLTMAEREVRSSSVAALPEEEDNEKAA